MVQKSKRTPFTEAFVKNLKPPAKGRSWHYDDKAAGLALMVTAAGQKSFYFYKWANGKPAQFKLGDWPAVSVSQARDLASEQLVIIGRGGNPQDDRRQRRRADACRPVGVLLGASRQAPQENLARRRADVQQVPDPGCTASASRKSRKPLSPSGITASGKRTARFKPTVARPSWRRCSTRREEGRVCRPESV